MRRNIPQETNYFHFYNHNYKNIVGGGDCLVRALGAALDMSWEDVVREVTEVGIKCGYVLNDKHAYQRYLKDKGYLKRNQPKHDDGTKYTGAEFCEFLNENYKRFFPNVKAIFAHIGSSHVVCIKPEGPRNARKFRIYDTWNSSRGCIGNYYVIE